MEIKNEVLPTEYVSLRNRSGMSKRYLDHAKKALKNSLFKIGIYEKDKLIAFGRVAGDGYITFVVTDIMVDKDYQRKGYGTIVMQNIDEYLTKTSHEDSYILLIAKKPADKLYSKFKFCYLDETRCGMLRKNNC